MHYFPKINAPFKRVTEGPNRGKFVPFESVINISSKIYDSDKIFADEDFRILLDTPWTWSEKYDGMSTGIHFSVDGDPKFFGRTKNTMFSEEQRGAMMKAISKFVRFYNSGLTLYGELVGPGIQGNPYDLKYIQFVAFDMAHDKVFWSKQRFFLELGRPGTSVVMTLREAVRTFTRNFDRDVYTDYGALVSLSNRRERVYHEGFVGTPDLCNLKGERIITKLKWKDFQ